MMTKHKVLLFIAGIATIGTSGLAVGSDCGGPGMKQFSAPLRPYPPVPVQALEKPHNINSAYQFGLGTAVQGVAVTVKLAPEKGEPLVVKLEPCPAPNIPQLFTFSATDLPTVTKLWQPGTMISFDISAPKGRKLPKMFFVKGVDLAGPEKKQ